MPAHLVVGGSRLSTMSRLRYEVVDVFTDRPFTGNPLAVVFDADGLAGDQMQAVAREFNLSETIFVLPPVSAGATYRVRIFTPAAELPFAGHPSVGAAATLVRTARLAAGTLVQECGAGLLPIEVDGSGTATLTGGSPTIGAGLDPAPLLAAAGLTDADFVGPAPRVAGCGLEFPYLSVRPAAVGRAAPHPEAGVPHVDVFAWDPETGVAHARVFAPGLGVPEDPGTGSAALGPGGGDPPPVHDGLHGHRRGRRGCLGDRHRPRHPGRRRRDRGPALHRLTADSPPNPRRSRSYGRTNRDTQRP